MQHTLVAVFDNRGDAQRALDELVSSGYPRERVRLSEGDPGGDASLAPDIGGDFEDDKSIVSSIRHFFSGIFGTDRREDARMYSDAIRRGHYVLTLTANSVHKVELAADIVERFGPLDIDEHASSWRFGSAFGHDMPRSDIGAHQGGQGASQQKAPRRPETSFPGGEARQDSQQRASGNAVPMPQEARAGQRQAERCGSISVGRRARPARAPQGVALPMRTRISEGTGASTTKTMVRASTSMLRPTVTAAAWRKRTCIAACHGVKSSPSFAPAGRNNIVGAG